jgi:hypothetical protein
LDKLKINIHLEGSSRSLSLTLPEWTTRLYTVFKLGAFLLFGFSAVQFSLSQFNSLYIKSQLQERSSLRNQLSYLQHKIDSMDTYVSSFFQDENVLYLKYGLTPPDENEKKLGIGGPLHPDSVFKFQINPVQSLRKEVEQKAHFVSKQIERNNESFHIIRNHLEQKFTNWRHIPSISPTAGRFSSAFGVRTHPITGERDKMHAGIDISNDRWTPIYASADGIVSRVQNGEFFGNFVVIDHGNGFETKYGHMHQAMVKAGQFVRRYDFLGYMGNTGRSTGNHLHYEVHFNGKPQNPMHYILPDSFSVD